MSFTKRVYEFREELEFLSQWAFEKLIYDLVKEKFETDEITLDSRSGRDLGFDIKAETDSDTIYVEVKHRRLLNVDEITKLGYLWSNLSKEPKTKLIIAISGSLSNEAKEKIKDYKIEVWDVWELYKLVSDKLVKKYFQKEDDEILEAEEEEIVTQSKEQQYIEILESISTGDEETKNEWSKYQKTVSDILEHLFSPPLEKPKYELLDLDEKNRRDIILENSADSGFWKQIRDTYSGEYIVVDAKNYTKPIKKRPVVDIAHYLKPYGCGMFGILVSRIEESESSLYARKEQWIGNKKMNKR